MFNLLKKIYEYNNLKEENELLKKELEKSLKYNLELESVYLK